MPGEAMPCVDVAGGSLQYRVAGQGEALLLIAGLGGLGSFWDAQIKAFSPRFRTITFDHRGVGESTGAPPYSAELWAQDIVALLDHLSVDSAHLIGHSTGGLIAPVVASAYPQRVASVVLGGAWAEPDDRFRRIFQLRRDVLTGLGMEAYAVLSTIMIAPPDESFVAIKPERTDAGVIRARIDVLLSDHGLERLRRIHCPALVMAAADDVLIPPHMSRIVADAIAGAELKVLARGGHAFPRSMPAEYNRLVLEFLTRVARRTATNEQDTRSERVRL
jgi:aminoacrylate hydrolase